jgi:hypothetical protein
MGLRRSTLFLALTALNLLLLAGLFTHAALRQAADRAETESRRALAGRLGLSDLCLFTEARYTRHPVMADLHTPFQDYPMSLEHFPSGSLLAVPPHLRKKAARGAEPPPGGGAPGPGPGASLLAAQGRVQTRWGAERRP